VVKAVVWKELREQGLIAVLLAVLGGALIIAASVFGDPPSTSASPSNLVGYLGAARLLTLMLVVTAGTVCGGALFAFEKETGTMLFLDALPVARGPLWGAKFVAGLALAALVAGALVAVSVVCGVTDFGFATRLAVYGTLAFAWGALGSTLARTTLGAVGVGVVAGTATAFVVLFPIVLFAGVPGTGMPSTGGWVLFVVLMIALPVLWSLRSFTAPDRARDTDPFAPGAPNPARAHRRERHGYGALVWLVVRQGRVLALVLSALALALGGALLLPELRPVLVWPPLALAAGVLTGVTVFGDEQAHGRALYWGEQRLPIGRAWAVKVAAHLLLAVWLLVLLALPALVRTQLSNANRFAYGQPILSAAFQSRLFAELGPQGWKYLFVPAAYGFAAGHLCGLLFRKLVVACGVAAMLGGVGAVLWGPSLLAGGLSHWQVWSPAVLALLTGRVVLRAWAADRLQTRGPLRALGGGAVACALACAAGVAYRALEVPDRADGEDDIAFADALPNYDQNVAGREFKMAGERYARAAQQTAARREPGDPRFRSRMEDGVEAALRTGWPKDDDLDGWLDEVSAEAKAPGADDPWPVLARAAAERPVGPFEPPQLVGAPAATAQALENARRLGNALLARGLQAQARGDHTAFAPHYRTVAALARCVRRGGGVRALEVAIELERSATGAAERWLENSERRADRAAALAALVASADAGPVDVRQHLLADRYVSRAILVAPGQWFATELAPVGVPPEEVAPEADLLALAWTVPWERERTRRLLGYHGEPIGAGGVNLVRLADGRPGRRLLFGARPNFELTDPEQHLRAAQRFLVLKAALRAHQLDRGALPERADELVARGYLAALPPDPYLDGQPLGYRVSPGETLLSVTNESRQKRGETLIPGEQLPVAPGRAILWSVGPDRIDAGGRGLPNGGPRSADIVVIVPEWK
jgi:hypothetical protein